MDPSFDPREDPDPLIRAAAEHAREYMSSYDASHGFDHILRVVRLALHILAQSLSLEGVDRRAVILAALLHDVGDHKYVQGEGADDPDSAVYSALCRLGAPDDLSRKVQEICAGVSYSAEVRDPDHTQSLLERHPELAVVQDADRIDALGAVGIGRMFTYGGAKGAGTGRSLAGTMEHLDEKLLRLADMAKTEAGRQIARERTERLRIFRRWWVEEAGKLENNS